MLNADPSGPAVYSAGLRTGDVRCGLTGLFWGGTIVRPSTPRLVSGSFVGKAASGSAVRQQGSYGIPELSL